MTPEPSLENVNKASPSEPLALYVHWPFCVPKCPYCDFNSHVRGNVDQDEWRRALLADLAHEAQLLPDRRLGSIFFGGGTPSLMDPATVAALIEAAFAYWPGSEGIEITLEANPSSVEAANFSALASAGVNRVSLGLQSLDPSALAFLGRAHGVEESLRALEVAQDRFARVSVDLIYALPGDREDRWSTMLDHVLAFGTGHLSLYQLTIEPGTRFAALHAAGKLDPLGSDEAASLFELTAERTAAAGLPAYEISNHSRSGEESRHNLTYWRYGDYAGIGPGAHGRRTGMRTVRHKKPENFLAGVARNGHGISEEAQLTAGESAAEALVMGLRMREGIDPDALARRFGRPLIDEAATSKIAALGLIERTASSLRLAEPGRLLLDRILAEIAA